MRDVAFFLPSSLTSPFSTSLFLVVFLSMPSFLNVPFCTYPFLDVPFATPLFLDIYFSKTIFLDIPCFYISLYRRPPS